MARVLIAIEDNLITGRVKIHAEPAFITIVKRQYQGQEISPAETYALRMYNTAKRFSKKLDEGDTDSGLLLPRVNEPI